MHGAAKYNLAFSPSQIIVKKGTKSNNPKKIPGLSTADNVCREPAKHVQTRFLYANLF